MFRFLFPRLTHDPDRGSAMFAALVSEARAPEWYLQRGVQDTLDGRFALLSTLVALATVRLEDGGAEGEAASVSLAERFVETMDAEHRQLGLGDPTLGKTVRKLMGALGRRVELWRAAVGREDAWREAALESLYRGQDAEEGAVTEGAEALHAFWTRIRSIEIGQLAQGRLQ
jgi:cytochrome b pre-mRNA-processing protein 3